MAVVATLESRITANSAGFDAGVRRAEGSLKHLSRTTSAESRSIASSLSSGLAPINDFARLIRGGGAFVGLTLVGRQLSRAAEGMAEAAVKFRTGEATLEDVFKEGTRQTFILGWVVDLFDAVRELETGLKAAEVLQQRHIDLAEMAREKVDKVTASYKDMQLTISTQSRLANVPLLQRPLRTLEQSQTERRDSVGAVMDAFGKTISQIGPEWDAFQGVLRNVNEALTQLEKAERLPLLTAITEQRKRQRMEIERMRDAVKDLAGTLAGRVGEFFKGFQGFLGTGGPSDARLQNAQQRRESLATPFERLTKELDSVARDFKDGIEGENFTRRAIIDLQKRSLDIGERVSTPTGISSSLTGASGAARLFTAGTRDELILSKEQLEEQKQFNAKLRRLIELVEKAGNGALVIN